MKNVSVLITDLDNTLWDWFGIWHAGFGPMLDELENVSGIERKKLIEEIKQVHQTHHTSEYSFVLQELPCLRQKLGRSVKPQQDFPTVIAARKEGRGAAMKTGLYAGVMDTLRVIKARGTRIIAFTESQVFYTSQRIRKFGLDGVIDVLYSPPDQTKLSKEEIADARAHDDDHYQLKETRVQELPDRLLKPNAEILLKILQDEGCRPEDAAYVGDNLTKDVEMARTANVFAVYAKYGDSHSDPRYELLRAVTHWTATAVENEKRVNPEDVKPDATLKSFQELLSHCRFHHAPIPSEDDYKEEVEIWKETVETQRHFNNLAMQLRSTLVTVLTAVVGAAGYAMTQHTTISIGGFPVTLGAVVAGAGIVALCALHFFEKGYYQMLLGAVTNGKKIEKRLRDKYPGIGLAHEIAESSHGGTTLLMKLGSKARSRLFYGLCFGLLVAIICLAQISAPVRDDDGKPPAALTAMETYYAQRHGIGVEQVCNSARRYLEEEIKKRDSKMQVAVFDIDETALSTWPILVKGRFEWNPEAFTSFVNAARAEPIIPVLQLYQSTRAAGVPVIFLSSRPEKSRKSTEENLRLAGYRDFEKVILKADGDMTRTSDFKQKARNELGKTRQIILNVGDQLSDLSTPPTGGEFLIPNPFYTSR